MFFDRLDERNTIVKSFSYFKNFTKWTFLSVNRSKNLIHAINNKFSALSFHSREYYLVDMNEEDK
jgi:hypothetical protein